MPKIPSPAPRAQLLFPWLLGALLLAGVLWRCSSLALGGPAVGWITGLCLLLWTGLALLPLRRAGYGGNKLALAFLVLALAALLRAVCLDHITYDYRDFLSQWAAFFRENGGFAAIKEPVGDYNAPYLYFMAAISYLPFPDLYAIKLFSILFDGILAWGGLRLVGALSGRKDGPAPLTAYLLLLLLPTVVLNGSFWGQCDALYGALVLHAMASAWEDHPKTSVALLAVAFSFKLQTIFLIPLWGGLWLVRKLRFSHLLVFPAAYAVAVLPALLLGKPLADILGVYFKQAGQYSYALVFNAPSLFALIPYGVDVAQQPLARAGILAAFALCLFVLGWLFFHRSRFSGAQFLAAAAVLALGVPFLLPYMHERYFFLADVVTLVWAVWDRRRIPIALLTQLASLSSYCVYLRLQYTMPVHLFGQTWTMALEALCILAALLLSLGALLRRRDDFRR